MRRQDEYEKQYADYTIGLFNPGFATNCYWGKDNLDAVSACGGGQTFIGTTTSELDTIYNKF